MLHTLEPDRVRGRVTEQGVILNTMCTCLCLQAGHHGVCLAVAAPGRKHVRHGLSAVPGADVCEPCFAASIDDLLERKQVTGGRDTAPGVVRDRRLRAETGRGHLGGAS